MFVGLFLQRFSACFEVSLRLKQTCSTCKSLSLGCECLLVCFGVTGVGEKVALQSARAFFGRRGWPLVGFKMFYDVLNTYDVF